MDRKIVPFRAWHYDWTGDTSEPGDFVATPQFLALLEQQPHQYTGIVDGQVVFCAGAIPQWATRHVTWAVLSQERSGAHMLWITRELRRILDGIPGRTELSVRADFTQGNQWAKLLGFRMETPRLERFGFDGEDHVGYVRIN